MDFRIGGVLELLRHDRAGRRGDDFVGLGDSALHAHRGGRQHQFGAQQGQHLAPLDRHRFRHDQNQLVAARGGHERQSYAGVAGSRLDEHAATGRNLALRLQSVDHRDADAILDAGDRVEELQLGQEMGVNAFFLGDLVYAHERRVADRIGDGRVNATASGQMRVLACCHDFIPPVPSVAESMLSEIYRVGIGGYLNRRS